MTKLNRLPDAGLPRMVTTSTADRRPYFATERLAEIVLDALLFGQRKGWYGLIAFAIMPDHLHLILLPEKKNTSNIMASIKGFTARKIHETIRSDRTIWQKSFFDYVLESPEQIRSKIRYIEFNPVKHGLVDDPGEYRFSSAGTRDKMDLESVF